MYISSLSLANFRNYTSEKIEFSPYTNVIYGDNAQGKTNILEAVYIFSQGRSHRAKSDKELIKFGRVCRLIFTIRNVITQLLCSL